MWYFTAHADTQTHCVDSHNYKYQQNDKYLDLGSIQAEGLVIQYYHQPSQVGLLLAMCTYKYSNAHSLK